MRSSFWVSSSLIEVTGTPVRPELFDLDRSVSGRSAARLELGLPEARQMAWGDDGTLFVGSFGATNVYAVKDEGGLASRFLHEQVQIVDDVEDGPAWERRKELGLVQALIQTWKEVLFNPNVSFLRMKTSGGYAAPFLFNLTMVVIYAFFTTIYQVLFSGVFAAAAGAAHNGSNAMNGLSVGLPPLLNLGAMIVLIPLLVGFTFVNAGITHLCLALFKGTSRNYEATYRVICYSYSTWIFALVPCAGGLVSSVWGVVSTIIGLSKVHRTEGWRAAVAVLLPVFVCMGIFIVVYIAIIAAVVASSTAKYCLGSGNSWRRGC